MEGVRHYSNNKQVNNEHQTTYKLICNEPHFSVLSLVNSVTGFPFGSSDSPSGSTVHTLTEWDPGNPRSDPARHHNHRKLNSDKDRSFLSLGFIPYIPVLKSGGRLGSLTLL